MHLQAAITQMPLFIIALFSFLVYSISIKITLIKSNEYEYEYIYEHEI